jgi:rfaE bifunctional protein kinase chain/domain
MSNFRDLLSSARVLVVGDLMLDEYLVGAVSRISPEAPVPVVDVKERRYVLGGAGNVAANVRALGGQVSVLGVCGNDDAGGRLRSLFALAGIRDDSVIALNRRTTTCKTRVVAGQQQIVRFDSEERSPLDDKETECLRVRFRTLLDQAEVCIFSDYGKGVLSHEFCVSEIEFARGRGRHVIVDPKGVDFRKYRSCTLITPNKKEAAQAAGVVIESSDQLNAAGKRLLELLPGSAVLVTRGPEGMTLFRPGERPFSIPTVAREVFDVVGAGDTVAAALAVSLAGGLPLEVCTQVANVAAGIAVGRHGTVAVSINDLLSHPRVSQLCVTPTLPRDAGR